MKDALRQLARLTSETICDDPIPHVVQYAKLQILDTPGVIIACGPAAGIRQVVDLARRWGGTPEGTILMFGDRVPAPSAFSRMRPSDDRTS